QAPSPIFPMPYHDWASSVDAARAWLRGRSRCTDRAAADIEADTQPDLRQRVEYEPGRRLREEVGRLLRHPLAGQRDRRDLVDAGRVHQHGQVCLASADSFDGVTGVAGVGQGILGL